VKLVDANLLLYATDARSPRHAPARSWLEQQLSGGETIAFAWVVLLAFVRLSTSPHVFARPLSPGRAFGVVDRWLGQPCAVIVHPGNRHAAVVRQLLEPLGTAANLVNDAHLAALALEHGAELNSCDADFSRFLGLRWVNPLGTS
jgi:toxin-antitoxin system PIN domain toxin